MPIDQKIRNIIQALQRLTDEGRLPWSSTPDEETFRASIPQGIVRIAKVVPTLAESDALAAGEDTYLLTLLDNGGRTVEQHRPSDKLERAMLSRLYIEARRSALKTDDFLEAVLRDLNAKVGNSSK